MSPRLFRYLRELRDPGQLPRKVVNQLRMSRWADEWRARTGEVPEPDRWIFVVGCSNSGTTLLQRLLGEHPDISSFRGEGEWYTDLLVGAAHLGWPRMTVECFDEVKMGPDSLSAAQIERLKRQWGALYDSQDQSQNQSTGPNLLEKTPSHIYRLPFFEAHFQPAYFIHIVRNGYAVAEGIRRRADLVRFGNPVFEERYPIGLCARQWSFVQQLADDHVAANPDSRFLNVRYENLVADPLLTLERITRFLGLPAPRSLPSRILNIHGSRSEIRNMNPEAIGRLTDDEIATIRRIAGPHLDRWGYES